MREELLRELEVNIDMLIEIIKKVDSKPLLDRIADVLSYTGKSIFDKTNLSSPFRQCFYLLGLVISNPNIQSKVLDDRRWAEICKLLQDIYSQYTLMFFPTKEDYENLPAEWWRAAEISMPVFLDYFNTGLLAYDEQIVERTKRWFRPFDDTLYELTGLTTDSALNVYAWFKEKICHQLDALSDKLKEEKRTRLSFLEQWEKEGWSLSEARMEVQNHPYRVAASKLRNSLVSLFVITKKEMYARFDDQLIEGLWRQFGSRRTEKDFRYITQENPALAQPLFLIDSDKVYCPCVSQFVRAAFAFLLKTVRNSEKADSFLKHRHNDVVEKAAEIFSSYFEGECVILKSVFERPDSQNEHDIVILYERNILLIEVKATAPKEPFRDPDRAFVRIERAFKGDQGIQKAYNQCLRLKQYILYSNPAILYDKYGKKIEEVSSRNFDKIYSVCLTADTYGIVALNLSLLLDKPEEEPFPWSCNLYDLETLLDAFKNRGDPPQLFLRYLDERARFHKKFFASDELEIAGFYLKYGSFSRLEKKEADKFMFTPDLSDIFDDIYFRKHGNRFLPYKKDSEPTVIDIRDEIREIVSGIRKDRSMEFGSTRGIGRNEPCPCGSGKKYKYCHGRDGTWRHGAG